MCVCSPLTLSIHNIEYILRANVNERTQNVTQTKANTIKNWLRMGWRPCVVFTPLFFVDFVGFISLMCVCYCQYVAAVWKAENKYSITSHSTEVIKSSEIDTFINSFASTASHHRIAFFWRRVNWYVSSQFCIRKQRNAICVIPNSRAPLGWMQPRTRATMNGTRPSSTFNMIFMPLKGIKDRFSGHKHSVF